MIARVGKPHGRTRVLHICTTFGLSSGSGANTRLTVNGLPRDRYAVFLAVPPNEAMQCQLSEDVTVFPLPNLCRSIRPVRDVRAFLDIYRLCKKWRFAVVHTHNSKDGILGRWAARFAGVPAIVHTIHNISFRSSRYRIVNWIYVALERIAARVTTLLLAVSRENVREYLSHGVGRPEQYRVVYSGLDLERYRLIPNRTDARASLGLEPDVPIAGWFGRFNAQKDPLTFIRAAREVAALVPDVQFVMCGDDPFGTGLHERVRTLASQLGMRERIRFLGFRSDLPVVLAAVDVVMHSSRYEGMGRTICEALLCGRAVAGTDVDGVREVIVSDTRGGILVPPGDAVALARAAVRLIQDKTHARDLASAGREWVQRHLSVADMLNEIDAAYELALSVPNRPKPPVPLVSSPVESLPGAIPGQLRVAAPGANR
ncbi:MAG TPA: glycosyltransferase family 4 protein [Gemmatimonadales bacterium]|nr:glycosyltransferase family 4 protein [Gemmatimonadales bacterium]